jgi:hypothetical protein
MTRSDLLGPHLSRSTFAINPAKLYRPLPRIDNAKDTLHLQRSCHADWH